LSDEAERVFDWNRKLKKLVDSCIWTEIFNDMMAGDYPEIEVMEVE
jgi:hypothetical protein